MSDDGKIQKVMIMPLPPKPYNWIRGLTIIIIELTIIYILIQ